MNTTTLRKAGLMVLLAGQLLPMIDFSIVNVALDAMAASLHATAIELALIVAIYGIAFAVCLAMGSRLGDNVGRRRLFISGVWLFALASLLCGLANNVNTLLLAGATGSLMVALALGPVLHWSWPCLLLLMLFPLLLIQLWRTEIALEKRGGAPLLPPVLLRLPSMRFGISLAVLFFSCWSGFMFAVALTLQSGIGMSAFSSGNAFIALGATCFIVSISSTRIVEKLGKRHTLLLSCVIQMSGLLLLMATFYYGWLTVNIFPLIPATVIIGGGQALIVSTFYRIGMADVPTDYAGAGSATLSTVQQATFGMGPMALGSLFTQMLQQGDYQQAVLATLAAEWLLMLVLVLRTLGSKRTFVASCQAARTSR